MKRAFVILILTMILSTIARARAADQWTLTFADFHHEQVTLRSIDDADLKVGDRSVPLDQFLQLDRASAANRHGAKYIAYTTDGDAFAGEEVATSGDSLEWKSNSLGSMKLSLRKLDRIVRGGTEQTAGDESRVEDIVTLQNGDTVRGVIVSIDAKTVSIQPSAGGDPNNLPADSVASILFAKTAAPTTKPASQRFRVVLSDGSALRTKSVKLQSGKLQIDGVASAVGVEIVESIEHINGPVVWLSSLSPSEIVQTPYIEMGWPTKMNTSVTGEPLKFAQRIFTRGIGVHSYSRITWPVDKSFKAFRTQYAIDGQLPYADVTVRVKLDGKTAYEQKNVRAGALASPVVLDTNGAASITLEVDYGDNGDVQDRFNWIEPALLRYKPAPALNPTTTPTTQLGN